MSVQRDSTVCMHVYKHMLLYAVIAGRVSSWRGPPYERMQVFFRIS